MTTTQDKNGAKVDLGLLEEDDEFEEFPADGEFRIFCWMLIPVPEYIAAACTPLFILSQFLHLLMDPLKP
jgi:hypothetical protein